MNLETIIYEKEDNVAIIKLNRPKVNALVPAVYDDLLTALDAAVKDPDVKAVVLEGEGRCFSAGADIKAVPTLYKNLVEYKDSVNRIQSLTIRMVGLDKPIIAACHQYALGGGLEIALCADIIIAAEGCKFGFPDATVGATLLKGATRMLPLIVGPLRAKELILTGEYIDAEEAKKVGLVNKVVPLEEMHKTAMEMARKIAGFPSLAIKSARQAINRNAESGLCAALELETYLALATYSETQIGMKAKAEELQRKSET